MTDADAAGGGRTIAAVRLASGALGLLLIGVGVRLLWSGTADGTPGQVAGWLVGTLLAHDLLLAPLVSLIGLALPAGRWRGPLRGGLLAAGALVLVALPPLLRAGSPRYPTSLPLDYPRGLLISLAAVALAVMLIRRPRWRGAGQRGEPPR
ncbi:hypothetical protein [Streptomyces profundus]|uniref:hypothetical protein n=1 Tax=Streptomyces profundus TaxID=2867410 RepID=UPI001D16B394|nr:hypothetical protein [Streptomyces sp. MA3_2.13]UED83619.1 hypothetical protein K4G22_04865 [Streptomyces sp. MA3_2.13]